jgi:Ca2+-binding RTX toxin-like protein
MIVAKPYGSEFLINTNTGGIQFDSALTGLADGRFVVTWTDDSGTLGDASQFAVHAQIFGADGTALGREFLVNTSVAQNQTEPSVTALADGRFVVVWNDASASGGDTSGFAARAQVFNGDGTKAGGEFLVNTTTADWQFETTITALSNGRFVVSWTDNSATGGDTANSAIRAQMFDADATRFGGEFLVNTNTALFQSTPETTALANGRFVITWRDTSGGAGDVSRDSISAQVFNADGTKAGAEFLVNTTTLFIQDQPAITSLSDGRFVISWTDASALSGGSAGKEIRAQIHNADGTRSGGEFVVNTTTAGNQSEPVITALVNGRFVIVWSDESATGADTSGAAIRAQVFNGDGTKAGDEYLVNTTSAGNQDQASVSTLADGRFVVSWTDASATGGDTSSDAIRGQIFDPREAGVRVAGTGLNDDLIGTGFNDTIAGLGGNDLLQGRGGNDVLSGNAGKDRLSGGGGKDALDGGNGKDILKGGNGGDVLVGGAGKDRLNGGDGRDELFGDAGSDVLTGGLGRDRLSGGADADRFVFRSAVDSGAAGSTRDVITDFDQSAGDRIDISAIDAGSAGGDQAFVFVANAAFSMTEGEVRYVQTASNTIVRADIDGDGVADFSVVLVGLHSLTAADFIL